MKIKSIRSGKGLSFGELVKEWSIHAYKYVRLLGFTWEQECNPCCIFVLSLKNTLTNLSSITDLSIHHKSIYSFILCWSPYRIAAF